MTKLRVDVWSDIACPWCYVGKRRLEAALAGFPQAADVSLRWRAFELDPVAPRAATDRAGSYADRLARKYGVPVTEAQARIDRLTEVALGDGLRLRFDIIRPGNTFDGHRLVHLARSSGRDDAMKERLLRAYFTEGEPIGDPEALARLGVDVGLDAREIDETLRGDAHADAVRADEREARELGIGGVPFFVFAGRYAVSGAQPADVFVRALAQAWADVASPRTVAPGGDAGAACDARGCGGGDGGDGGDAPGAVQER